MTQFTISTEHYVHTESEEYKEAVRLFARWEAAQAAFVAHTLGAPEVVVPCACGCGGYGGSQLQREEAAWETAALGAARPLLSIPEWEFTPAQAKVWGAAEGVGRSALRWEAQQG